MNCTQHAKLMDAQRFRLRSQRVCTRRVSPSRDCWPTSVSSQRRYHFISRVRRLGVPCHLRTCGPLQFLPVCGSSVAAHPTRQRRIQTCLGYSDRSFTLLTRCNYDFAAEHAGWYTDAGVARARHWGCTLGRVCLRVRVPAETRVTIACTGVREPADLKWKILRAYPVTRIVTRLKRLPILNVESLPHSNNLRHCR
ncbi:hypothetical protein Poly51_02170 [Rubripirellula tenax]|uniref:Uncharacterized protein n=1 Tax=Rubripirellula tenax TaxID=2528015 RepID=A0A5C6FJN5_9BACT|nr:hypothetical protein Poly51_02170 [Rubripirellula tenax]